MSFMKLTWINEWGIIGDIISGRGNHNKVTSNCWSAQKRGIGGVYASHVLIDEESLEDSISSSSISLQYKRIQNNCRSGGIDKRLKACPIGNGSVSNTFKTQARSMPCTDNSSRGESGWLQRT